MLKYAIIGIVMAPTVALAQEVGGLNVEGILNAVGLSSGAVVIILAVMRIAEVVGKLIPDSATGAVGKFRQVLKFLGAYVSNKA